MARRHGPGEARWAAFLLALGTTLAAAAQAWSGEAAATCAVAAAVLLLVRSEEEAEASPAARAGLPLGLAVAFQPSTAALALVLVGAVLLRWRREGLLVLAWAAPGVLVALGALAATPAASSAAVLPFVPIGFGPLALLLSPAKGAFVFAPVALVGAVGLARALRAPARRLWDQPQPSRILPASFALAAVAHFSWLAVAGDWAAGEFWGPRWVAPVWPLLLAFVPEGFALLGIAASLLAVLSVAVQALGAFAYDGRWDRLHRGPTGDLRMVAVERARQPDRVPGPREDGARGAPRDRGTAARRPLAGRRAVGRRRLVRLVREGTAASHRRRSDDRRPAARRRARASRAAGSSSGRWATASASACPRGPGRGGSSCASPAAGAAPWASARAPSYARPGGATAPSRAPSVSACPTTTRSRAAPTSACRCAPEDRSRSSPSPSCRRPIRTTCCDCRERRPSSRGTPVCPPPPPGAKSQARGGLSGPCWSSNMTNWEVPVPQFNVAEAKARFSELVQKAVSGEEVVIARDNRPLLRLVPLAASGGRRKPGSARGRIWMAPDFDRTPEDFEGYVR